MSDDAEHNRPTWAAVYIFVVIGALAAWDVVFDYRAGASLAHVGLEALVMVASVFGIALLWRQLGRTRSDLEVACVEADQWRKESQKLMQDLGDAIENQFDRWGLSEAEAEVGLLLLKGLSHKAIANTRNTSERTAREQARALYRKSGLHNRSALSAFFLEDLLLARHRFVDANAFEMRQEKSA